MLRSRSNHTAQLFRDALFNHVLSFSFLASDLIKVEEKVVKERNTQTYLLVLLPPKIHAPPLHAKFHNISFHKQLN